MTFLELAIKTLEKSNEPLTVRQIWNKADDYGFREELITSTHTPIKSLEARIYCNIRDDKDTKLCIVSKNPTKFSLKQKIKDTDIVDINSIKTSNYPDEIETAIDNYITTLNILKRNVISVKKPNRESI